MIQDIALQVSAGGQCTSVLGLEKCRSIDRGFSVPIRRDINPICDRRVSLACPSCGRIGLREFYDAGLLPVHNVLVMETYEEAISHPMGEVSLGLCEGCGFITNTRFDPSLLNYSSNCEDTQHYSAHFNQYADSLVRRLVDDLGIRRKTVVEIGSGGGDFLDFAHGFRRFGLHGFEIGERCAHFNLLESGKLLFELSQLVAAQPFARHILHARRVDRLAVAIHFVMEVRTGREPG